MIERGWAPIDPQDLQWLRWADKEAPGGFDPYLVWGDLTRFRGFSNLPAFASRGLLPVLFRLRSAADWPAVRDSGLVELSPLYPAIVPGTQAFTATHATGLVKPEHLGKLKDMVLAFELGMAAISPGLIEIETSPVNGDRAEVPTAAAPPCVLGVIDDGFAILHEHFRTQDSLTRTRFMALWDQGATSARPAAWWQGAAGFAYGQEMRVDRLPSLLGLPDASRGYEELGYLTLVPGTTLANTHGTQVLDLAAGQPHPLTRAGAPERDRTGDVAIVAVHVPEQMAQDTSGGAMGVHILDGIRYVLAKAQDAPVVVNLSWGSLAGPHDGKSLLESAMDELLSARPNTAIVIAAGNGAGARCHRRVTFAAGAPAVFEWTLNNRDPTDSFVEFWFDAPATGRVVASVIAPESGGMQQHIGPGEAFQWIVEGQPVAAVIHTRSMPVNGASMLLVAIGATGPRNARMPAPQGQWQLSLALEPGKPDAASKHPYVVVDAYIERDEAPVNSRIPRGQFCFSDPVDPEGTLNSIATGTQTIVVGGYVYDRADLQAGAASRLSARGPTRDGRPGVHVHAPSALADEPLGLPSATVTRAGRPRLIGTSAAAPLVSRFLVNFLADHPGQTYTAEQLREAVIAAALIDPLGTRRIGLDPRAITSAAATGA